MTQQIWSRRRFLGISGAVGGAAALPWLLAGCGDGSGDSGNTGPMLILYVADPNTLDPAFAVSPVSSGVFANVFEPLAGVDATGKIEPILAESWEVQSDQRVWRFKLRPNVTFQNGEPLDAEAVKFSTDRMADPALKAVNDIPRRIALDSVEIVDTHTVDIITKKPTDLVEALLYRWYIVPPKHYQSTNLTELARKPVGTGPYQVTEYVKDDHLLLDAWPRYREGAAPVGQVRYRIVPELSTRVAEMKSGQGDILVNLDPDMVKEMTGKLRVAKVDSLRRVFISINTARPPLNDVRVRQALNYAVNFDAINTALLQGAGTRMAAPLNGAEWVDPDIKAYPYDVDRARSLLAEAGVGNLNLELSLAAGELVKATEICEAVASDLAKVGITVKVAPVESSVYEKMLTERAMKDLYLAGLASQLYGPKDMQSFAPESNSNATSWPGSSPRGQEFMGLYSEMMATFDRAKKKEKYFAAARILHDEAPAIFLWNEVSFFGASDRTDWDPKPMNEMSLYGTKWRTA